MRYQHCTYRWGLLTILTVAAISGVCVLFSPPIAYAHTVRSFTLGLSGQGRPIEVIQVGSGLLKLVVVGNTHGGPELNTYTLTRQLADYFRTNPAEVPASVRLYLIPTLNPDGLALGSRLDAQGVDLNRNMNTNLDACPENDWQPRVFGANAVVADTGGPYAESQIESRLIRDFLLDASGAIFLHSNAGLVFPAFCEHAPSQMLGEVYATAAGYLYSRYWTRYMITGGMHDWAGSLGIASITPELLSGSDSEFDQNLAGLKAVLAQATTILPPLADQVVDGYTIPARIWRYWRTHGGVEVLGPPIEPAHLSAGGVAQTFSRARLEQHNDQADTPFLIQPALLGNAARAATPPPDRPATCPPTPTDCLRFAATNHTLREAFRAYWERNSGLATFGYPQSEEFTMHTADGVERIVQYFERALFAYYPEDNRVRPEPLGAWALLVAGVRNPGGAQQVR